MSQRQKLLLHLNVPAYPVPRAWMGRDPLFLARQVDWDRYVEALGREVGSTLPDYAQDHALDAMWVGGLPGFGGMERGGIALHMADPQLGGLLRDVRTAPISRADGSEMPEITLTAHPGMVATTALDVCRRGHAGRVWVDFATSNSAEAARLGRFSGPEAMDVTAMVLGDSVRRGAIDLGMGLMAGIPGQTSHSACSTVEEALRYGATWIGITDCPCEDGEPADDLRTELRASMEQRLREEGFRRYLEGHWALPGHESRFLLGLAAGTALLGFGAGARTAIDGMGAQNTSDVRTYLQSSDDPAAAIEKTWLL